MNSPSRNAFDIGTTSGPPRPKKAVRMRAFRAAIDGWTSAIKGWRSLILRNAALLRMVKNLNNFSLRGAH
jgi:hypothetical protein